MFPFWAQSSDVTNDEIKQLMGGKKAVPYVWRCAEDIEPILNQAVELITMDDSERRSVILVNPGLAPKRATVSTMYTAYRLNDANEIMPPHKHSPSAVRFGLKGKGNFTGVDGENIVFGPGDMVLTPNDTWHNHGTVGDEQALNLSVLDFPLVETLNAVHFDHNYMEEENGKMVQKKQQSERFTPDYSQRIYGYGGLMPRFCQQGEARRRLLLADVRLSLGDDARIAGASQGLGRRPLRGADGRIYRSDLRPAGVQDHHLLRADAAAGRADAADAADRAIFWSRRSRAAAIRSSTASASTGRNSTRSRCRAAPGASMSTTPTRIRSSCSSPATSRP